eukprot:860341_1
MGNGLAPNPDTEVKSDSIESISDQGNSGICYAHATATAICETENRIIGRTKTAHKSIVKEITDKYGCGGAHTPTVLEWQCNKRNLKCNQVYSSSSIMKAVDKKRVVVASFRLTKIGWDNFS